MNTKNLHILFLFIAVLTTGCSGSSSSSDDNSGKHYVKYEVSTYVEESTVHIVYLDENGETKDIPDQGGFESRNWTYSFYVDGGANLYLCAWLNGDINAVLHTSIYVDSVLVQTTSTKMPGAQTIAQYTVPLD